VIGPGVDPGINPVGGSGRMVRLCTERFNAGRTKGWLDLLNSGKWAAASAGGNGVLETTVSIYVPSGQALASGFGIMWTMAHGALGDWLSPNIVGLAMPNEAPLAYWIGAILIRVFGWLTGDALAARVSILVFFAIGTLAVWRTAYVLGRRSESQPLKLAFGGQPAAMDYGRTLADGALLIYVASLGLLLRSHETAATALQVSLVAVVMYAAACLFDRPTTRAATGLGVATGLLLLTASWITPLLLFVSFILVAALRYREVLPKLLMISLPIVLALPAAWLLSRQLTTATPIADWLAMGQRELGMPSASNIR
jgi:4-amino-4-deoxy-L-arabinose transferase-like glycosyltransferase